MNKFTENKWTGWLIGLLVALNLMTLTAFWVSHNGRRPHRGPYEHRSIEKFFAKKLNLTEEQTAQFKTLLDDNRDAVNNKRDYISNLRNQRMEVLIQPNTDTTQLAELANQIAKEQFVVEELLSEHYFSLRTICNDSQKEKLGDVFRTVILRKKKRKGKPRRKEKQ